MKSDLISEWYIHASNLGYYGLVRDLSDLCVKFN